MSNALRHGWGMGRRGRRRDRPWLTLLCLLVSAGVARGAEARAEEAPPAVVFVDATVVDVAAGRLVPGRAVVVNGPTIAAVVAAEGYTPPDGAVVVPAGGKYLIPGLWDMHVHLAKAGERTFPLRLFFGELGSFLTKEGDAADHAFTLASGLNFFFLRDDG